LMIEIYNECIVPLIREEDAEGNFTVPLDPWDNPKFCDVDANGDDGGQGANNGGGGGPVCGNGIIEVNEECDDGNLAAGDGCNGACATEVVVADSCSSAAFDGGGLIGVPTAGNFDYQSITIELWYRRDGGDEWLFGHGFYRADDGYRVSHHNGGMRYIRSGQQANDSAYIPNLDVDGWNHLAISMPTGDLFVNGVRQNWTNNQNPMFINAAPNLNMYFGGWNDRNTGNLEYGMLGRIASARISTGIRYNQDFIPGPLNSDNSTQALWDFGVRENGSYPDLSGNGHSAFPDGTTADSQDCPPGFN
jgi:cysteine-rich repeat protein